MNRLQLDWIDMLKPFSESPSAAFHFARTLTFMRKTLEFKGGKEAVIGIINDLIDALFPYTYYYHAGIRFYRLKLDHKLTAEWDPTEALLAIDPTWSGFLYPDGEPDYMIDFTMPFFPRRLGEKLKRVRERVHLKPNEFAQRVGATDGAAIQSYESDKADPPLSILYRYVELSGAPLDSFLDDDNDLWGEQRKTEIS
jgi:DNA-binding XRE family transcriptional regulator